jgi:MSHA pilin protein MshC
MMRLTNRQSTAIKQQAGKFHGAARAPLFGRPVSGNRRGFTLVELVMTMVIVGILGAVVAPRLLTTSVFQSRGFADQVQATLRYAQKIAIAQHRFVCVAFTINSVKLTTGTTNGCGTELVSLSGAATTSITANPASISFTATPAGFYFDALGKPSLPTQNINVNNVPNSIVVEAETGYVHSP